MNDVLLEAVDLTKLYVRGRVEVPALRGVSLELHRGEFVCVTGPPGAGKSTLLHLLGLLDSPTSGAVMVGGENVSRETRQERAELRLKALGFVFQFFNLLKELTALENVTLPMLMLGTDQVSSRKRAEELLGLVGLADRMHHRPSELSGGQQQRVAVARSLANEPDILLADEPTGNLDSKTSADIRQLLADLSVKMGQSLVVVSHEREWIDVAQRIIPLRDGRILTGGDGR